MASTRQRDNGKYVGLYRDANGKQRSAGTFTTEKEAQKAADRAETFVSAGANPRKGRTRTVHRATKYGQIMPECASAVNIVVSDPMLRD